MDVCICILFRHVALLEVHTAQEETMMQRLRGGSAGLQNAGMKMMVTVYGRIHLILHFRMRFNTEVVVVVIVAVMVGVALRS